MSSKLIGADSEFFSKMVVEAAQDIKVSDSRGGYNYLVKAINVLKAHGKSSWESMIKGYATQQIPRSIFNAQASTVVTLCSTKRPTSILTNREMRQICFGVQANPTQVSLWALKVKLLINLG